MPAMTVSSSVSKKSDFWIPWYFVFFFIVIAVIDGSFVFVAIRTQTGLVTEQAYEKGLAFNKTLEKAAEQRKLGIIQKAEFKDGKIIWHLQDKNENPLVAKITAHFYRPTHDGYDFEVDLKQTGNGMYEAAPRFPLPGAWTARLEAVWQNRRYDTKIDLIAP